VHDVIDPKLGKPSEIRPHKSTSKSSSWRWRIVFLGGVVILAAAAYFDKGSESSFQFLTDKNIIHSDRV